MIHYGRILQTGIQSLLAVACGWGCGRWGVVDPEPTVQYTNTLVLRFCIPCLQVWLLAVKTDMQQADNWWALLAFLLWSLGLQALLALHQLLTKQRLQLDRLGVDGLILTTNNTGILGPVVLQAAVGPRYAPLGMLATVVLYFQQLPLAQLLFQLHQRRQQQQLVVGNTAVLGVSAANGTAAAAAAAADGYGGGVRKTSHSHKVATSPEPSSDEGQVSAAAAAGGGMYSSSSSSHLDQLRHLHHTAGDESTAVLPHRQPLQAEQHGKVGSSSHTELVQSTGQGVHRQGCNGFGSTGCLAGQMDHQQGRGRLSWDLEQQQQQQQRQWSRLQGAVGEGSPLLGAADSGMPTMLLQQQQQQQQHKLQQQPESIASYTLSLLLKNPLVWSTAVAVLLSALGSAALLDPSSPLALQHLAFLEALLGWFAQTTAPLTLFTTGLWMFSNIQRGRADLHSTHGGSSGQPATAAGTAAAAAPYGSKDVAWWDVGVYLGLRATLAPALMVVVCRVMGFRGDLAHALVILALLPVAQTAFVVCKQAECGMAAVSLMLVVSLLVMLPQLMVVLALLERLGLLSG